MSVEADKSNKTTENDRKVASQGTLRAISKVSSWTMVSRILGFVRDIFIARLLGASVLADAFFVAFKIPNFFRRMFAEGTLTVAMVPVLAEERRKGEEAAHDYLNALAGMLLLVLLLVTVLGMLFMPWLLLMFAPGFQDEPARWDQSVLLARWMFPYLLMISLCAMSWAVLNAYRRFAVAAASPALLNVAILFAAIVLAPGFENPALALAVGVVLGGALQLGIQFPALRRIGWLPRPNLNWRHAAIKKTMRLFGPAVLGVAAVQVNILVGTILATLLSTGAVSYLYYADRIVQLPLALFGIAMGTVLLPALSEQMASHDGDAAKQTLSSGLAWLTWITLPAVVGVLMLSEPIITTLFESGRFTHESSMATAQVLQAYGFGLLAFCWVRVLSMAYYAGQDATSPMRFAMVGVVVNIALALVLMRPLGAVGLALATSLAAFVNVGLLWWRLKMKQGSVVDGASIQRMLRAAVACVPMAIYLLALQGLWSFPADGKWWQCLWLGAAIPGSMMVYFGSAMLLGERLSLRHFRRAA